MSRFIIEESLFGSHPLLTLRDTATGTEAAITPFGATLLAYRIPLPKNEGALFDITDGFQTPEELENGKGARAWVMLPFSNRIDQGTYTFDGTTYAIPMANPASGVAAHGFVRQTLFDVSAMHGDDSCAQIILSTSILRPGAFEGYPFSIDIRIVFTLTADKLDVCMEGTNIGDTAAPFAGGWHPYFRTGTHGIEHVRLTIPSMQRIVTGDRLLPLAGAEAYVTMESAPELDFRPHRPDNGNILSGRVLDGAYTELTKDADGWSRSIMEDSTRGIRVTVYQEGGVMHVFTGDTLPSRQRASLAMEPVMQMTNAFNRPECADGIRLEPGATRTFRFGVQAETFSSTPTC